MDIVTVVPKHPFYINQILLQAESIQKFVEPCTHWIVINETNPDMFYWHDILDRFYTKHELRFWNPSYISNLTPKENSRARVMKFSISEILNDKYLCLDCKNFFIKPCSIEEWRNIDGSGASIPASDNIEASHKYAMLLNKPLLKNSFKLHSPFVMNPDIIKPYIPRLVEESVEFFSNFADEYMCYSYMYGEPKETEYYHKSFFSTFKHHKMNLEDFLTSMNNNEKVKMISFSKFLLNLYSKQELDHIRNFLHDLGFKNSYI